MFAAGLLAVMSACKKENTTSELRAVMNDFANSRQKAYIDAEKYSCFIIGEKMRVNSSTGTVVGLTRSDRQCRIDGVDETTNYYAFYPYHLLQDSTTVNLSSGSGLEGKAVYLPQEQVYRTDASGRQIIDNPMMAVLTNFNSENNTLHFRNLCALLKITVCTSDAFDAIHVTFGSDNSSHYKLWGSGEIKGDSVVMNGSDVNDWRTVILRFPALHYGSPVGEVFYIMIPSVKLNDGESVTVDIRHGTNSVKNYTHTLPANTSVTLRYNRIHTLSEFTFNAAMFSVSATRKVVFSPGNLQWSYTNGGIDSTTHSINGAGYNLGTWRFAPNQYDVRGAYNTNAIGKPVEIQITPYYSVIRNTMFYNNYQGWIDLFAWGGSGYGDSRPYYYNRPNTNYYCQDRTSLSDYDWGAFNAIYNPKTGNVDPYGTWRTLAKNEWDYLINSRSGWRYSLVSVDMGSNNILHGLIIYTDNNYYVNVDGDPNNVQNPFCVNSELFPNTTSSYDITKAELESLISLGCAFLPNAGYMKYELSGNLVVSAQTVHGYYLSCESEIPANSSGIYNPYYLFINEQGETPKTTSSSGQYFYSVRLVRDVQ